MDNKARFDQIESLLADLARGQDKQSGQIQQIITELNRQGEALNQQGEAINRQGEAINRQGEALNRQGEAINRQGEAINQQGEAINRQGEALNRQGDAIGRQGEAIGRIEQRLDNLSEQVDDLLGILKISAAAHKHTEEKQGEMLVEIREQGRRLDAQAQRQDTAVEALKILLNRAEAVDKRVGGVIESQRQIIQLAQLNTQSLEDQEPRIQRLEDELFRQAS